MSFPSLYDDDIKRDIPKTKKALEEQALEKATAYLNKARQAEREKIKDEILQRIDTEVVKNLPSLTSKERIEVADEVLNYLEKEDIKMSLQDFIKIWADNFHSQNFYDGLERDLQIWYSQNFEEQKIDDDFEFENDILNEEDLPKDEKKDNPEPDDESLTAIEAPEHIFFDPVGVNLPSQIEPLEIAQKIEPLQKQKSDIFKNDDWSLKNVFALKMEILKNQNSEIKSPERKRSIRENTKIAYQDAGRRVSKVLGETPTQEQALKYLLKSALYDTDGTYHLNKAGVRELYNDTYNSLKMALPKPQEREKMKLNRRRSGLGDVRDSRPMVKARTEELDPDKMSRIIEALPRQWHRDGVLLLDVVGCRRCELPSLTVKLTGRDCLEFEYVVSKQKDGKEHRHKIKIHKKNFPDEFVELGKILIARNGSPSLRQSGFEKVRIFTEKQKPKALEEAFRNARNRLGYDKKLYKLHSERHQFFTEMEKAGLDVLEQQKRSGHKELKNVLIYGNRKR